MRAEGKYSASDFKHFQRRALSNISKCVNEIRSFPASRGMSFLTSFMI
jgi:hypothetical protein